MKLNLIGNNASNLHKEMKEDSRCPKCFINGVEGIKNDIADILNK